MKKKNMELISLEFCVKLMEVESRLMCLFWSCDKIMNKARVVVVCYDNFV